MENGIMDVSKVVLNKDEYRLLCRIRKSGELIIEQSEAKILSSSGLIIYFPCKESHTKIKLKLNPNGERFFTYRKSKNKQSRWEWIRYGITTLIAVAALVKSFFFT